MINKEIFYNINNILNRNKLKEEYVKKHLKNEYNLIKEFQKINNLYNLESFSCLLYHYCNNIKITPICNYCKNPNNNFLGFDRGYSPGCCRSCNIQLTRPASNETRRLNTIAKHGVEHTTQLKSVQEKMKKTNLELYGVEHYCQTPEFIQKIEKTNMDNYGVKYPLLKEEFKQKSKETILRNYGVDNSSKSLEIVERIKKTNVEKFGKFDENMCLLYSPVLKPKMAKINYT